MTMQDTITIESEVPAITQGEASTITNYEGPAKSAEEAPQSTASSEPLKEQDKPQADTAPEANPKDDPDDNPEPYPMDEELQGQFNVIEKYVEDISTFIMLAAAECGLVGREIQLKDALTDIDTLRAQVELAIKLNAREKQVEDKKKLEALAKEQGYRDWAAMRKALDCDTEPKQGANSAVTPTRKRSVKDQPKVFKWVLREDAPNVTADDPPGYVRLPDEQKESGKYRLATTNETKRFEADVVKWKADQLISKKP